MGPINVANRSASVYKLKELASIERGVRSPIKARLTPQVGPYRKPAKSVRITTTPKDETNATATKRILQLSRSTASVFCFPFLSANQPITTDPTADEVRIPAVRYVLTVSEAAYTFSR